MNRSHLKNPRGRAGGHKAAMQGARSVVWYHHMSDEQRRSAAKWPRPEGLRPLVLKEARHTALRGLALARLGVAAGHLSGTPSLKLGGGNASHGGS
jgi:hypothetical protein